MSYMDNEIKLKALLILNTLLKRQGCFDGTIYKINLRSLNKTLKATGPYQLEVGFDPANNAELTALINTPVSRRKDAKELDAKIIALAMPTPMHSNTYVRYLLAVLGEKL